MIKVNPFDAAWAVLKAGPPFPDSPPDFQCQECADFSTPANERRCRKCGSDLEYQQNKIGDEDEPN